MNAKSPRRGSFRPSMVWNALRPLYGARCFRGGGLFVAWPLVTLVGWLGSGSGLCAAPLFINEVVAENSGLEPPDIGGGHPDLLELYNDSDEAIVLGAGELELHAAYALSDTFEFDPVRSWHFPLFGSTIGPKGRLVVFCDANDLERDCELHASFRIDNDGSEPLSLWGPEDEMGNRPLMDRVWLPPLRNDHSFGRSPDGAGPSPVPLDETLDVFQFFLPENTTLGTCADDPEVPCTGGRVRRVCPGAPNREGDNLEPRIDRESHTSSAPLADEPVYFVVRVEDDKIPSPPNIASVEIVYSVDGVPQEPVAMVFDEAIGVLDGSMPEAKPGLPPPNPKPFRRWSFWNGAIPGLPAGSRVAFEFRVEDQEGLVSISQRDLCPEGTGPCDDAGLPGSGCVLKAGCVETELSGCKFDNCDVAREYTVGYEPPAALAGLVINEVVAAQTTILPDPTQPPCSPTNPRCAFEDFIELMNSSDAEIDLSGLWLSDRPFHPQGWQFPAGSTLGPGGYLIVWADNDGGKCPRPAEDLPGDGQECPDPTDPSTGSYHTNFRIESNGDQILLFERVAGGGFGLVHVADFDGLDENVSWSLIPDGDRNGQHVPVVGGSPLARNEDRDPEFLRGDANGDCAVDLSDAIFFLTAWFITGDLLPCPDAADVDDLGDLDLSDAIFSLNFQFQGGRPPPAPGPHNVGVDPTEDTFGACVAPPCP